MSAVLLAATDASTSAWAFLAGVFAAGLVSSIETALVGVSEARIHWAIAQKQLGAAALTFWLKHPARVLTTLHLLRLALVLESCIWGTAFLYRAAGWQRPWMWASIMAMWILLFSHVIPRVVAKRFAFPWAMLTMPVVRVAVAVLTPVTWPLIQIANWLGRLVGSTTTTGAFWTAEELAQRQGDARHEALGKPGQDLYRSIIEFSDTLIREIMVPRTEMVAVAADSSAEEIHSVVTAGGHSRIPIYDGTIDHVIGVLHVKDLVLPGSDGNGVGVDLRKLARRTFFVPEVMKISELLREIQRRKTHMAIVVDEYGGTAGVVTLEDVMEEIVGEIHDEYDVDEKQYRRLSETKLLADGRISVWDLEQALGVEFPANQGFETLAGFVTWQAGCLPEPGSVVKWRDLRFTIKDRDERRIGTIEIEKTSVSPK